MGTPDFACFPLLRIYNDGHDIAGVFTQPDKPQGRGMKLGFSPVKETALKHSIPVYQPVNIKDGTVEDLIRDLYCDMIVVVAYGRKLPVTLLELPPLGCVNIHASLLPKYRGAAPIQWAIIKGEYETGVTAMYIDEEIDAGDIILSDTTEIGEDETAGELYERLKVMGAELISKTIDDISNGSAKRFAQDHDKASYAPPLDKASSPIDWTQTAHMIKCKVRGLNPWPVATAIIGDKECKVFSVSTSERKTDRAPGEIVYAGKGGIEVACADGTVYIEQLQAPGGKRMPAADYARGRAFL